MERRGIRRFGTIALAAMIAGAAGAPALFADESTVSVNALRTGWDSNEPALSPAAVPAVKQLFNTSVNGQVFAQPLVVNGVVIVATETNHVYGIDAVTGKIKWTRSLGPAWPSSAIGCGDLTPPSASPPPRSTTRAPGTSTSPRRRTTGPTPATPTGTSTRSRRRPARSAAAGRCGWRARPSTTPPTASTPSPPCSAPACC
ncbi:PQQ-binding-like beta-propeller repeat protein [Streptacidiphilus monticola]